MDVKTKISQQCDKCYRAIEQEIPVGIVNDYESMKSILLEQAENAGWELIGPSGIRCNSCQTEEDAEEYTSDQVKDLIRRLMPRVNISWYADALVNKLNDTMKGHVLSHLMEKLNRNGQCPPDEKFNDAMSVMRGSIDSLWPDNSIKEITYVLVSLLNEYTEPETETDRRS